jgi:CubicO group peptidase (beta-lactamase class C family)
MSSRFILVTVNVKKMTHNMLGCVRRCLVPMLALLAGAALPASAQQRTAQAWTVARLDSTLEQARVAWDIPGMAVAIVRRDSVLLAKGYGVREMGKPERVDENTLFDAASLTKSFTSAAIAALVDEGRLRWDDPVRRHLPSIEFWSPSMTSEVTLRDLLSHRTGLEPANASWYFTNDPRSDVIRRMRHFRQRAPFRTTLVYSNIGYTVAGEASAAAAGVPWAELIRTRLLVPLGMTRSTASFSEAGRLANVASPHAAIDGVQRAIAREGGGRDVTAPAGAVQSSAADLARWLRFQLGGGTLGGKRIVSDTALAETHAAQVIVPTTPAFRKARALKFGATYGMGWQVWDNRGRPTLWHSGTGDGQMAFMALYPEDSLGVVVLINSWVSTSVPPVHGIIAGCITDALLGLSEPNCIANARTLRATDSARTADAERAFAARRIVSARPSRPLAAYAGVYADSVFGRFTVRLENGSLVMQVAERGEVADLTHWHLDTWLAEWRRPFQRAYFTARVTFAIDGDGAVSGLRARLRNDEVSAARVSESALR